MDQHLRLVHRPSAAGRTSACAARAGALPACGPSRAAHPFLLYEGRSLPCSPCSPRVAHAAHAAHAACVWPSQELLCCRARSSLHASAPGTSRPVLPHHTHPTMPKNAVRACDPLAACAHA